MEESATGKPRRSLTQRQLQEPAALELVALLQTITDDGRLLDSEVQLLNEWLTENKTSTLPAVIYLRESVETVVADGRVTPEECSWLQKVVETVLPKEERAVAVMRRREAMADDRRLAAAEKERQAEIRRLSQPIATFDVMVAGVLYEGRATIVSKFVSEEDVVFLVREPNNPYSRNATLIRLRNGLDIGYVPETEAVRLAPLLDQGALHSASVKKVLRGGRAPWPVIWGELYSEQAQVPDAVAQQNVPFRQTPSPQPLPATRFVSGLSPFPQAGSPERNRSSALGSPPTAPKSRWALGLGVLIIAVLFLLWLAHQL